jgi:hypothetical protein
MATPEDLDPDTDPFRPPAIPTLVGCLHCQEEYESYRIEWRVEPDADGKPFGFWCCPTPGCGGRGFGFDILPVDPEYQDERGGWVWIDEDDIDESEVTDEDRLDDDGGFDDDGMEPGPPPDDSDIPW